MITASHSSSPSLRLCLRAGAGALMLMLAACSPKPDKDAAATTPQDVTLTSAQAQHIHLHTVASGAFAKTVETQGVVDFDNDQATSVLAPFSGPVSKLLVETGQAVREGQPLATVDSPDFSAAVEAYRKAIATAKNARRLADVDDDLLKHNSISEREAQQADTDAAGAESDLSAARQALVALRVDAAAIRAIEAGGPAPRIPGVIRSPITGTVVEKLITPGQLLAAGDTPAFTVADLSKVWVMAQLTGSGVAAVRVGDPVEIDANTGAAPITGVVDNISDLINPDTRAVIARVVVANPHGLLRKAMYVHARIRARQTNDGLTVPVSAVLRDDLNLPFVYVADANGGYARRRVTLGDRSGDSYAIPTGLKAGDRVVADGGIFLQFVETQ